MGMEVSLRCVVVVFYSVVVFVSKLLLYKSMVFRKSKMILKRYLNWPIK